MKQIKFYQYTIVGLLILNIGIIAFLLLTKPKSPHPNPHNDFQSEVVRILHLNNEQEATFKEMAKQHQEKMISIDRREQELLLPYFQNLSDTTIQIDDDKVLNDFQRLEKEKIMVTHQHFEDLKSILKKDQLLYFKHLTNTFIQNVILKKGKNAKPSKDLK